MVATSYDPEQTVLTYRDAPSHIAALRDRGVEVYHGVDATRLCAHPVIGSRTFHQIVFNFPHTGGKRNKISENRTLLREFFASAAQHLDADGRVIMLLCRGQGGTPADGQERRVVGDSWQVVEMAAKSSLILSSVEDFIAEDYDGYTRTGFRGRDQPFNTDRGLVHVFTRGSLPLRFGGLRSKERVCSSAVGQGKVAVCELLGDKLTALPVSTAGNPVHCVYNIVRERLIDMGWSDAWESNIDSAPESSAVAAAGNGGRVFFPHCLDQWLHHCPCTPPATIVHGSVQDHVVKADRLDGRSGVFGVGVECSLTQDGCRNIMSSKLALAMSSSSGAEQCGDAIKDVVKTIADDLIASCGYRTVWHGQSLFTKMDTSCGDVRVNDVIAECTESGPGLITCNINLDTLACLVAKIDDSRWLWTRDHRLFKPSEDCVRFHPVSLYPEVHEHHISFWLPTGSEGSAHGGKWDDTLFHAFARAVCGDCLINVSCIDSYCDPGPPSRHSRTYLVVYQSVDQAFSWEDSVACQLRLRDVLSKRMGLVMR